MGSISERLETAGLETAGLETAGPKTVAVGGGHGTAVTLRALRHYASEITAVVSVADDGGSSGRLRELLQVVALGDLRKCLVALADPGDLAVKAFEHRFDEGELEGHSLGNLMLAALVAAGDLLSGIDAAASMLGAIGRVLPATTERVVLKAEGENGEVAGQVAVSSAGRIRRVSLVPADCRPPDDVVEAIGTADQVVIGPGSLYTSVLAAAAVPGIAAAIRRTAAQRVYVCNLRQQLPETAGYDVANHVAALSEHGVDVDVVLCDTSAGMARGAEPAGAVAVVDAALAVSGGLVHDPGKLARELSRLLA